MKNLQSIVTLYVTFCFVATDTNSILLCPASQTDCYSVEDNTFLGCCKGKHTVCCGDQLHCCPQNFVCSDSHDGCVQIMNGTNMKEVLSPNYIVCEDGVTKCPDYTTCCPLPPGGYGCCEYSEAKCCFDKTHCCPQGFDCVEGSSTCKRGSKIALIDYLKPRQASQCEDNRTVCFDNTVCCEQFNKTYACCPSDYPMCCGKFCCPSNKPVCCGMQCCAEEADCDPNSHKCNKKKVVPYSDMQPFKIIQAIKVEKHTSTCSIFQTPCEKGCCPDQDSTCCANKNYCCPQNFSCISDGQCIMTKY